ncbi:hypothetical protein Sjap_004887 [Stephania japonica]|uniref:Uncharacterized protein n=1 Tax=Stephania japonica TaxID=461633 RepID=A0AAP0PJI3_9MAGN
MNIIQSEVKKLNGCVRQVEYMKQSGASNENNMNRAKEMFAIEVKNKRGFRFAHNWKIVKGYEKFKDIKTKKTRVSQVPFRNYDSS